jgi:hypothetical protein
MDRSLMKLQTKQVSLLFQRHTYILNIYINTFTKYIISEKLNNNSKRTGKWSTNIAQRMKEIYLMIVILKCLSQPTAARGQDRDTPSY